MTDTSSESRRPERGRLDLSGVGRNGQDVAIHYRLDSGTERLDAPLVLCLHGHGMNEDWFALLIGKLFDLPCHFLVARAPFEATAAKDQSMGASWYDYDGDQEAFLVELARTERLLLDLLASFETPRRLQPKARYLLGFSQGGYCGSYVAVRNPDTFDGMIVSGARVKTEVLEDAISRAGKRGFRTLLCHGKKDPYVLPEAASRSRDGLEAGGVEVTYEELDAGHSVGRGQVSKIRDWLGDQISGIR